MTITSFRVFAFATLTLLVACKAVDNDQAGSSSESVNSSSVVSSESSSAQSSSVAESVFPTDVVRPQIMIVGDSISAGPGCYKKYLDEKLRGDGITEYDFIGEYSDDCGGGIRHSAVSCTTTANYLSASFSLSNCFVGQSFPGLSALMASHNPDLVMLQLGVNDIWGGATPIQSVLDNYTQLIEQMYSANPNVVVVVAQIHKVITDNCTNQQAYQNAQQLVQAMPSWLEQVTAGGRSIFLADLWTNSNPEDADDCVHPNDAGARKMADNWFDALAPLLR